MPSALLNYILEHEEGFQRRLPSLYADFSRDAKLNPDNYLANSEEWRRALYTATRAGAAPYAPSKSSPRKRKHGESGESNLLSLHSGTTLLQALEVSPWGRPAALGAVISEAIDKKEMLSIAEFLYTQQSIYTKKAISIPSPWQVVGWGLRQIGLTSQDAGKLPEEDFAIVQNIEAAASALQQRIQEEALSPVTQIHSMETFRATYSNLMDPALPLSTSDLELLLTYCSRDKPILHYDSLSSTVKLTRETPIEETDRSIAQIRTQALSLERQTTLLEDKISSDEVNLRAALGKKDMSKARSILRSKKLATAALDQRRENSHQLAEILFSIERAADSVAMMRIMSQSADTLRVLNKQTGGIENVDRVTDRLREEMEKGEDVQRILNEIGAQGSALNDEEIDAEFEALQAEEKRKEDETKRQAEEERTEAEAQRTAERLAELNSNSNVEVSKERLVDQSIGITNSEPKPVDPMEQALSTSMERLAKMDLAADEPSTQPSGSKAPNKENREQLPAS